MQRFTIGLNMEGFPTPMTGFIQGGSHCGLIAGVEPLVLVKFANRAAQRCHSLDAVLLLGLGIEIDDVLGIVEDDDSLTDSFQYFAAKAV